MANLRYLFKNIVVSFNHQGLQLIVIKLCTTITCFYSNMTRPMTLWYGKELALFGDIGEDHPSLQVQRVPGA